MATNFTVDFGGSKKLQASPLTLIYYNEEFSKGNDADMLSDFVSLSQVGINPTALSGIKLMRIIWACEKTYKNGSLENFNHWVKMLDEVNYQNKELYHVLASAFQSEYFRSNAGTVDTSTEVVKED